MPKSSSRGVVVLSTLQLTACTWARAPHPSHPGKLQAASAKRVQASEKEREREKKNDYGRSLRQTTTPLFGNLPTNPPIKRRASESGVLRHHSRKEHIQPEINRCCSLPLLKRQETLYLGCRRDNLELHTDDKHDNDQTPQ